MVVLDQGGRELWKLVFFFFLIESDREACFNDLFNWLLGEVNGLFKFNWSILVMTERINTAKQKSIVMPVWFKLILIVYKNNYKYICISLFLMCNSIIKRIL